MSKSTKKLPCPICQAPMSVKQCRTKKPSLMLKCPVSGKHIRGFIADEAYVEGVLARAEDHLAGANTGVGTGDGADSPSNSETELERGS